MTWLYLPNSTCSMSSPEAECSDSPSTSDVKHLDTSAELWVTSSGKPMLRPRSWRGWKTRPWIQHLFGTILPPSTAQRGADAWISSLRDSRASHTPQQARNSATMTPDPMVTGMDQFPTSCESWTKCDPPWSSAKMFRGGLWEDISNDSGKSYVEWATISKTRSSSLRQTLARATSVSASSSWPTPVASDDGHKVTPASHQPGLIGAAENYRLSHTGQRTRGCREFSKTTHRLNPRFAEWTMGWPLGWSDCDSSVTGWSHYRRQLLSRCCSMVYHATQPDGGDK